MACVAVKSPAVENLADAGQRLSQQRPQPFRARGQQVSAGSVDQKPIGEQGPQARERPAGRGLAHAEPRCGAAHAALVEQRVEHDQQVEVGLSQIHFTHIDDIHHALDACQGAPLVSRRSTEENDMFVVLGANGRAGGETARALIELRKPVRVVLRRPEQAERWTNSAPR